jgi:circadian clock protein KaiB
MYVFTLYITGENIHAQAAIKNLQRICETAMTEECEVQIVDVLQQPEEAETHYIIATPTLVKLSPAPTRRVIGDLSDLPKVLSALGLEISSQGKTTP